MNNCHHNPSVVNYPASSVEHFSTDIAGMSKYGVYIEYN